MNATSPGLLWQRVALGLFVAAAPVAASATTWAELPVSEIYEAAETVVYVTIESGTLISNGDYGCGARYEADTILQFKGTPAEKITFFGHSGPKLGGTYLLFLRKGNSYGFGMASTNSISMGAAAEAQERCAALRDGFERLGPYGQIEADWNLVTGDTALKVYEDVVRFPEGVPRAGRDADFGETDRLYGARWIPLDPAFAHLRELQRVAEPDAVIRRVFLHNGGLATALKREPGLLSDFIGLADRSTGGEREEWLELAGRVMVDAPLEYLSANLARTTCFGIGTVSWQATADDTWSDERRRRRDALASVTDPKLAPVRDRCLAELDAASLPAPPPPPVPTGPPPIEVPPRREMRSLDHLTEADLEVRGRIWRVQGACNGIACPDMQYEIETYDVRSLGGGKWEGISADIASITACVPIGLDLGGRYEMRLRFRPEVDTGDVFNRALSYHSKFVACDYVIEPGATTISGKP